MFWECGKERGRRCGEVVAVMLMLVLMLMGLRLGDTVGGMLLRVCEGAYGSLDCCGEGCEFVRGGEAQEESG